MTGKGIDRERIPYKSYETEMLADPGNPNANARVTFSRQ